MSQTLASLSRNLVAVFVCALLAACNGSYTAFESDRDFDIDDKTADIERDNAELKTLATLQSAFFGHYQSAINEFLDASDLPIDAVPTVNEKEFERICSNGGSVLYSYSRDAGEEHKVGDRVSVDYNDCIENGATYSGSMTGRYTEITGLNNRFVEINTSQCLDEVKDELSIAPTAVDRFFYEEVEGFYKQMPADESSLDV